MKYGKFQVSIYKGENGYSVELFTLSPHREEKWFFEGEHALERAVAYVTELSAELLKQDKPGLIKK
jgi:hypothetical protein